MYELISVFIKSIYIAKLPYVTAGLSSIYDIADYFNLLLLSFFRPQVAKAAAIRWMISVVHISFLFFFFLFFSFYLFIYLCIFQTALLQNTMSKAWQLQPSSVKENSNSFQVLVSLFNLLKAKV